MTLDQPQALLFDLGGVLIDIDFGRATRYWQAHSQLSLDEIRCAFAFDEPYERHERGEISAADYFRHLKAALRLDCNDSVVLQGWNSIYVGEIAETIDMIRAVRRNIPCYAFTNTNAVHMEAWTEMFPRVAQSFDQVFASHELGMRKPEARAFDHIAGAIGLKPASIAFFDDLPENVAEAHAQGFRTVLVTSPEDVRRALLEMGHAV